MPASQERGLSNIKDNSHEYHLTHREQYARAQAIQDALRKAEAATPRENAPKAGQIRSLGLIGKEEDTKSVLGAS